MVQPENVRFYYYFNIYSDNNYFTSAGDTFLKQI